MPVSLNGTTGIVFNDASTQNTAATGFGFKNRLINSAMMIDQRNAGASVTPTDGQYALDRFLCFRSQASKYSVQQNAGSVTPPVGFTNYLGVTSLSAYSITSSDYFMVGQKIEGFNFADLMWGTANASAVTLSFWVRSSLTGTFGGTIQNVAQTRSYPFSYTISAANTWEYKTITVAGDTSGTWVGASNAGAVQIFWGLGIGSSNSGTAGAWASSAALAPTGATSVVGTNGATFYITGVQLEKGSTATSFDYRPYGTELALCQRYFLRLASGLGSSGAGEIIGTGTYYNSAQLGVNVSFPVTMRTSPSIYQTTGNNFYGFDRAGATDFFNSFLIYFQSPQGAYIYNNSEASGTGGQAGNIYAATGSSYVGFNSEL
jgi:hypothetical protein